MSAPPGGGPLESGATGSTGEAGPFPRVLGRYRLLKTLGRGGMGVVYLAEDTVLGRQVALKIPTLEGPLGKSAQERFFQEARAAAAVTHPHICQIHDIAIFDGQVVMAMEYVDGRTLARVLEGGRSLAPRQAVGLARRIALAMQVAHERGLVHRDLKPANVMLSAPAAGKKAWEPKIMDFGLAKTPLAQSSLTATGIVMGTPAYMSKEQWAGKEGDLTAASDVYSLGVMLYRMLTGAMPYDVEADAPAPAWLAAMLQSEPVPLRSRRADLEAELEAIVLRAIASERSSRFATMAEFAQALELWLRSPASAKPEMEATLLVNAASTGRAPTAILADGIAAKPDQRAMAAATTRQALKSWSRRQIAILGLAVFGLLVAVGMWLGTAPGSRPTEPSSRVVTRSDPVADVPSLPIPDAAAGSRDVPIEYGAEAPPPAVPFAVGDVYEGDFDRYEANERSSRTHYHGVIHVKERTHQRFRSQWSFVESRTRRRVEWTVIGNITSAGELVHLEGTDGSVEGVPVVGGLKLKFVVELAPDGRLVSGTVIFDSGAHVEFEAARRPLGMTIGLRNLDFSEGLTGWTTEGEAAQFEVAEEGNVLQTRGDDGRPLTGRLFQTGIVPAAARELVFDIQGGKSSEVYVALKQENRILYRTDAESPDEPTRITWGVDSLRGRKVTLEIVDRNAKDESARLAVESFQWLNKRGTPITPVPDSLLPSDRQPSDPN